MSKNQGEDEREKEEEINDLDLEVERAEQVLLKPNMELNSVNYDFKKLEQRMNILQDDFKRFPQSIDIKKMLEKADRVDRQDVPNSRQFLIIRD